MIRMIAALDDQRGIATDDGIPWTLPEDSKHFRDETTSGLILMGWVTYTEFATPLHDRDNYVLSRSTEPLRDGFLPMASLDELRARHPDDDVWVIGGAAVYARTIDQTEELVLTQVLGNFHCTKFFPPYAQEFVRSGQGPDRHDGDVGFRFETWTRRQDP
jgi:dihydrofolate reductase